MLSSEFVEPYTRYVPPVKRSDVRECAELVAPAHEWSHVFGEILHDYLTGRPPQFDKNTLLEYTAWYNGPADDLAQAFGQIPDEADKQQIYQETHFHVLNNCLLTSWLPLVGEEWPSTKFPRGEVLQDSKAMLAAEVGHSFHQRKILSGPEAGYAYFDKDHSYLRKATEGMLNELDAAYVGLEVIRRNPNWLMLPAPLQFERTKKRSLNIDFIYLNLAERRAVGKQMKSMVTAENQAAYPDRDRVVLVDGARDFGNERTVRTSFADTTPHRVNWGGLICATAMSTMPNMSTSNQVVAKHNLRILYARRIEAMREAGNFSSLLKNAANIVYGRVAPHLGEGRPQQSERPARPQASKKPKRRR